MAKADLVVFSRFVAQPEVIRINRKICLVHVHVYVECFVVIVRENTSITKTD